MALFRGREMPSIKKEIEKLDKKDSDRKAAEKAWQREQWKKSTAGQTELRIENAVKQVHVEKFSQEDLDEAQAELAEAVKGQEDERDRVSKVGIGSREAHGIAIANSQFWKIKIAVATERIRQLKQLETQ